MYIGTSLGFGIGLYSLLPRKKKPVGRKVAQFLVGGYMLGFLGFIGFENMQIEGFFFYLLSGFFTGAVIHYLVAKVFLAPFYSTEVGVLGHAGPQWSWICCH